MHGRPRKPAKPEDEAASAAKSSKLRALQSQFLNFHQNKLYDKEAVEVSAKLLEINPEFYTAWNYRKLAVEHFLSQPDSDPQSIFNEELRVAESALRQNFKSYGAWHHRKWVLNKGHSSVDHELLLLDKFQKADPRNFHAWNYRRYVAALKNIAEEDELKYTTTMIEKNFSNYSAWHNRSVLLSNLLKRKAEGFFPKEKVLTEEYDLVHQALFTDPDDQSGWFYHLWLLEQTITRDSPWLISCWPAPNSEVTISAKSVSSCEVSPFATYSPDRGTIPVILYFNQAVKGVNTSTVAVKSAFAGSEDIIWRPLSVDRYGSSQVWVGLLKFPYVELDYSINYPVEVSVGDSSQIKSLSEGILSHVCQFKFVVHFQQPDSEDAKGRNIEAISWENAKFEKYGMESGESDILSSFNQLEIDKDEGNVALKWKVDTLVNEIDLFRELLSAVECKIGKLTLARLLTSLDTILSESSASTSSQMVHTEEILSLYSDLVKMDPPHSHYYKEEHSLAVLQQVTSCKDSLLRYCWRYGELVKSDHTSLVCMRLNHLSLARLGSIENLLWVQMLDLSHNELGSVEGLEALQLLSCLNLGNNKIRSFTALNPLRQLKLLKVLNISHNEIGKHSIDSTRYLCASPLSHSIANDWKRKLDAASFGDADELTKYWEAYIIFKDLSLTQLDITGNAIVDEDFRSFLLKILPTLKWLDARSL